MKARLLLLLLIGQPAWGSTAPSDIEYLLAAVANSGCQFERNGSMHDSVAASAHMRKKYDYAKRWIDNAEQFIERIGTGSSMTGKPYHVTCDGKRYPSRDWLMQQLSKFPKEH
ncbi:MAG: DUF5329 family protein [bacterium]